MGKRDRKSRKRKIDRKRRRAEKEEERCQRVGERQQQFYGNVHTRRERQGALTAGIEPVRQVRGFSLPEILMRALSGWMVETVPT